MNWTYSTIQVSVNSMVAWPVNFWGAKLRHFSLCWLLCIQSIVSIFGITYLTGYKKFELEITLGSTHQHTSFSLRNIPAVNVDTSHDLWFYNDCMCYVFYNDCMCYVLAGPGYMALKNVYYWWQVATLSGAALSRIISSQTWLTRAAASWVWPTPAQTLTNLNCE